MWSLEPLTNSAATIKKAAEEISAGTLISSCCFGHLLDRCLYRQLLVQRQSLNMFSLHGHVTALFWTIVVPLAVKPAIKSMILLEQTPLAYHIQ